MLYFLPADLVSSNLSSISSFNFIFTSDMNFFGFSHHISENPDDKEKRRFKYLDQEKYDYIQNYLDQSSEHTKDADSHSAMTVTSDSGMRGSNCASSEGPELGTEDAIGKI